MKEFELTMKLRNNLIKKRRVELGLTAPALAKASGVNYHALLDYENLRLYPVNAAGQWRANALKLADFFRVCPEDLFPEAILAVRKPESVAELEGREALMLSDMRHQQQMPPRPDELLGESEERAIMHAALGALPQAERRLLEGRFLKEMSADDVRQELWPHLSRERTRQLEVRALGRMRQAMLAAGVRR